MPDDGGIAIVEAGDDLRADERRHVEPARFPKVNLGEVAETGVGEGGKQRVLEVDLAQKRVVFQVGFGRGKLRDLQQTRDGLGAGRGGEWRNDNAPAAGELPRRGERRVGHAVAEHEELRLLELERRHGLLAAMRDDLDALPPRLWECSA